MMRSPGWALWAGLACVVVPVGGRQDQVPTVLAAARAALGGDAALNAVTTFTVKGTRTSSAGSVATQWSLEYVCALPDRFVARTEHTADLGPLGTAMHLQRTGFNGNDPIYEVRDDSPVPPPTIAGRTPTSAGEIAAERSRLLTNHQRTFVRLALPLFAEAPLALPLTMTSLGRVTGPTGPSDVIEARAADGFTWQLFFDASTHLLSGISWKAKPIVVMSVSSGFAVNSSGRILSAPPAPVLPPDPAANLDDVQWQLTVGDYRKADGLTWPHRFTSSYGGRKYEETKLGAYKINPKIDPAVFRPMK